MRNEIAFVFLFLSSCAIGPSNYSNASTKVSNLSENYSKVRHGYHTVVRGDTLNRIAKKYNTSIYKITKENNISSVSTIYPGQQLKLNDFEIDKVKVVKTVNLNKENTKRQDNITKKTSTISMIQTKQKSKTPVPIPEKRNHPKRTSQLATTLAWKWPAKGRIIRSFNSELTQGKGVHIQGKHKSSVVAIGDGTVVYSGDALKGYGNLIIIKHKNNYLSAYAHNHVNVVKEGEGVRAGQHIADMGRYYDESVLLHFELRKDGKPVDPQRFISP
ncbi:MAG: peptidoglycan DD-metalloendopeptidase family protein [Francisellaceae bacterium]|jgi:lipoprotein NlpD|nr:peptidoglycan DD-metalloendopeptidase family protein [Francisellaceae bacterium]MBT6207521.1 peptidoglycan DD-metalloendopeptidase family protein [Francisellaceae bacterium]MBT6537984.1 peptidoglycan DD-metalloendopeptidase family protein [Francisellaceae bacterium]